METKIEYRVRPITRFIVTRFECNEHGEVCGNTGGSTQHGEFDNFETAYAVGYALCKQEHERLGWPLGDERIQYPRQLLRQGDPAYAQANVTNAYATRHDTNAAVNATNAHRGL